MGTYQASIIAGGLIINAICYGTGHLSDNRAWRIPIGCFFIVPTIIASLILLVPESPRWLLKHNRLEEARTNLHRLRAGAFSDEEIETEFQELLLVLEREQERGKGRFRHLFDKHNLKRTAIVIGVNFFQQATGQAFASQYGAIYVKSLGTINPQLYSLMNSCLGLIPLANTLLFTDKVGRR